MTYEETTPYKVDPRRGARADARVSRHAHINIYITSITDTCVTKTHGGNPPMPNTHNREQSRNGAYIKWLHGLLLLRQKQKNKRKLNHYREKNETGLPR